MKAGFYPKLAVDGIRKNKRLYVPYLLTCAGMVMMFYTNSFLMRRRKKEYGLYNMLGMSKANLRWMLLWETAILFVLSMAGGLLGGIAFSKLAELCLTHILGGEVSYDFTVNGEALRNTLLIFIPIFGLILLKSLIELRRMSAVSLLRSENVGEKPPKTNLLLGIGGVALLAAAYFIAVTIQSPLMALSLFFFAVALVIVATYLIFISGSVLLCRLLQRNKNYYCIRRSYDEPVITMSDGMTWQIKAQVADIMGNGALATDAMPTVYIVVAELEPVIGVLNAEMGEKYAHFYCRQRVNYGFDLEDSAEEKIALCEAIRTRLSDLNSSGEVRFYSSYAECREEQREDFYGTYGGIFFLGILLSIVFLLLVMAVSVLVFGLFYAIVYKVTSAVYLSIVSGTGDA